jgi:hypothetical protein
VAKSAPELIRELTVDLRVQEERLDSLQDEVNQRKAADEKRREEIAELRRELAEDRQENAVLKQQLQDHVKHTELSDARRWTMILALLGAALSLAGGLIVALARK